MTKKVYVLNDGGLDYSDAEQFGNIVICSTGALGRWDTSHMLRIIEDELADAQEDDFLVVNGLTAFVAVATGYMASRYGRVNFLMWKDGKYIERTTLFT